MQANNWTKGQLVTGIPTIFSYFLDFFWDFWISARSRRNLGGQNPAEIQKSRRPKSCKRIPNLGGQNPAEISGISAAKILQKNTKSRRPKSCRDLRNLGGQNPAENLAEIPKS